MDTSEKEKHIFDLIGGSISLDFVNTQTGYKDKLTPTADYFNSYADLLGFAQQSGLITPAQEEKLAAVAATKPTQADAVLTKAKVLRLAIRRMFNAADDKQQLNKNILAHFNAELAEAMSHAQIAPNESGFAWSFQPAPGNLESILWPVIKSAADLLVSDKIARVHECAGDTCGWMFIDTTKNHSRRWCDMRDCGNTVKARRFYSKRRKQAETA